MTPGTRVRNARGWVGTVTTRPAKWDKFLPVALKDGSTAPPRPVVYVEYEERADLPGGKVISQRPEDLEIVK